MRGKFIKQNREVSFLFDSGSDLSLISTDKVNKSQLDALKQLGVKPRSIQGTPLVYHGFLELDVSIGGHVIKNQKFHIVDNLVCPFVAGIDLICSLGPMYIDWNQRMAFLQNRGQIALSSQYEPPTPVKGGPTGSNGICCLVRVAKNTTIPSFS